MQGKNKIFAYVFRKVIACWQRLWKKGVVGGLFFKAHYSLLQKSNR